jgi:hypothetical protein
MSDDNVKWTPSFTQEELEMQSPDEQLAQAVFQAIGSASMCWEDIYKAGVFRSDLARSIGDGLLEWIRSHGEWSTQ